MTAAINSHDLRKQILQDVNACEALLALLEAERNALAARDTDSLDKIIEQKITQLGILENSAKIRTHWVTQLSQGSDSNADIEKRWEAMIANSDIADITEQWQKLKSLQTACQTANDVNGKILARSQRTNARVLDLMRGQTAPPNLYTAKGNAFAGHSSNKVGEA